MRVIVKADGGARGNPGNAGCGAIVFAEDESILAYRHETVGFTTNNDAEYHGLILGLKLAAEQHATEVSVLMDSQLVVNQMSGKWKVLDPKLDVLVASARTLARRFDFVSYTWIPRDQNQQADELANAGIEGKAAAMPTVLAGPVSTRVIEPTGAVRRSPSRQKQSMTTIAIKVEKTAGLATRLGVTGTPAEMVDKLRRIAADDLEEIWETFPGATYLTDRIRWSPLSWRSGVQAARAD